jgi:hypothetical protein
MVIYNESDNKWSISNAGFGAIGHAYDGNGVNPDDGTHYFAYWDDRNIKTWKKGSWGTLPRVSFSITICNSLSWFPDLYGGSGGLVLVSGQGILGVFNGSSWTKLPVPSTTWGGYEVISQYSPVHKVVMLGGGNSNNVCYTLNTQLQLTRKSSPSFTLAANQSLNSLDPVGGNFIVYDMRGNQEWWEFDPSADTWSRITGMVNEPSLGNGSLFHTPIPEHNVIMVYKHAYSDQPQNREVWLYRHSKSTGSNIAAKTTVRRVPGLDLYPNPFNSSTTIQIDGGLKIVDCRLKIYNANGVLVEDLTSKIKNLQSSILNQITWNASQHPAGIYTARITLGNQTFTKKLFLIK